MEEHTVEVTFEKDFDKYGDPESFVESCLTGSRSNSFAANVQAKEQE